MELRLYDTLSREKRTFVPLDPKNVRMYVCGPTVYDFAHIGNARPVIVFDVLFRLLRHLYGEEHVTYVRNITDVDDKINDRAARDFPGLPLNEAIRKVTETDRKAVSRRRRRAGLPARRRLSRARPNISREMRDDHRETADQGGFAYVARRPRAVFAGGDERGEFDSAALRRARQSLAGRDDRRRPRRCRALQARGHRFRAVEAVEAGRAVMAVARRHQGRGASGLARRMLGNGVETSRRAVRYPWRRHRPGVSAS